MFIEGLAQKVLKADFSTESSYSQDFFFFNAMYDELYPVKTEGFNHDLSYDGCKREQLPAPALPTPQK